MPHRTTMNRREFTVACTALGLSWPVFGVATDSAHRNVRLPDGTSVAAVGQGSSHLGQDAHPSAVEEAALRTGVSLGMTLLDTSGNYGGGRSEEFIGKAIAGRRDQIFLVTKVEAGEIEGDGIARACAASLNRLGTNHIDLYLLHWPVPTAQFAPVVAAFETLRAVGKIRAWGVSNFDKTQMEDLFKVPDGRHCATNQVPYSLKNRRIERDLLPWCAEHNLAVMAYSPLGGDHNLVIGDRLLSEIGDAHGCSAAAVALAWVIRSGKVIAIPESGTPEHVKENAAALSLMLTPQEIERLSTAYV